MLGGDEARFARMMTAKARALGMSRTTFRNASGLPDPSQVTTARDMATLGMALRQHFPGYFKVFATRSFTYGKRRMANHNKLLGRVSGVDGIKTGYTRASGYNLVTSAGSGNKRIVAVVMGGKTGKSRDQMMASLVGRYLPKASTKGGNGAQIARTKAEFDVADADDQGSNAKAAIVAAVAPAPKPNKQPAPRPAQKVDTSTVDPVTTASVPAAGWVIQVASMPDETQAKAFLGKVRSRGGSVLSSAHGYTVPFDNKGQTFFRARFAGFAGKAAAQDACATLKKMSIACYATQQ
jgi:D-alanyl-D-alanine carboxypeptidase